jgi:hypothetical protein
MPAENLHTECERDPREVLQYTWRALPEDEIWVVIRTPTVVRIAILDQFSRAFARCRTAGK